MTLDRLKENRVVIGISIAFLICVLILLSISAGGIMSTVPPEEDSGNTTIFSIYRQLYGMEPMVYYFLDLEHRIYPDSITVPGSSHVTLFLDFTINFNTPGTWNVQPTNALKLEVEVPRMPSGCSIESYLDFVADTDNREFYLTVTFYNTNVDPWNVGRPMIKILNIVLGQPSNPDDNATPEVQLYIEMNIT